jgi:flagellar hook-associated protein 3 FlgL
MRVSTTQMFDAGVRDMLRAQAQTARTQAEIASGKRVLTPADDPSAATLALRIEQEIQRADQFTRNVDAAERDLRQQETHLGAVENVLFRLRELMVQAGNGGLAATERSAIVAELSARGEELQGIFNSRMANGEYQFSGFQGLQVPFVQRAGGAVDYRGDTGQRSLEVAPGVAVEVRDNGRKLFVDIAAANQTFVTVPGSGNSGSGDIDVGRILSQADYDAVFPDDIVIRFDEPLGPDSYTVYRRDRTSNTLSVLAQDSYTPGDRIQVAGTEVRIVGAPAAGDEFMLQASKQQSLLTTIQRAALVLGNASDTSAGGAEVEQIVAETLANLVNAESHVFAARAELGSRLNVLQSTRDEQEDLKLINRELVSQITDLDYNEALSRLSFQSFALEAAQKSFARVSGISLFNYL